MRIDPAYLDAETALPADHRRRGASPDRLGDQPVGAAGVLNLAPFSCLYLRFAEAADAGHQRRPQRVESTRIPRRTSSTTRSTSFTSRTRSLMTCGARELDRASARCQRGRGIAALERVPGERIKVPRLVAAPIAMECRFRQCLEFGETRSRLIVGEVLVFHIRDGLLNNGKIETKALDPIARIAGPRYADARRDRYPRNPCSRLRKLNPDAPLRRRRRICAALIRRSTTCIF